MDPASVTGLIGFSLKSIAVIYKYITDVQNASETVTQLQGELGSLKVVLGRLESLLKTHGSQLDPSSTLFQATTGCYLELNSLQRTLDGVLNGNFVRRIFHRLKWPLDEADTTKVFEAMHRYLSLLQISLTTDGLLLLSKSASAVQGKLDSLHMSVLGLDVDVQAIGEAITSLETHLGQFIHEEQHSKFLQWLPGLDFDKKHTDVVSRRLENLGRWLLDGDAYCSWSLDPSSNSTLFCHGGPGVGKTFLT